MAIHYFFKEELVFENFYSIVKASLKSGGHFLFTVFNGKRVRELINNTGDKGIIWLNKNGNKMLQLQEGEGGMQTKSPFNNKLTVFLETIGEHPEYLVDIDWLLDRVKDDFTVVKHESFEKMHDKWFGSLTQNLAKFSFLYDCIVLRKK